MSAPTAAGAATASGNNNKQPDVVARYHKPLLDLLIDFGDEILDVVRDQKKVDVDDIREAVLAPMRAASKHMSSS